MYEREKDPGYKITTLSYDAEEKNSVESYSFDTAEYKIRNPASSYEIESTEGKERSALTPYDVEIIDAKNRNSIISYEAKVIENKNTQLPRSIPLGPATITFRGIGLGYTLKEDDTTLKIEPIIESVKTDESSEVKEELELGRNVTLSFSLPFTESIASVIDIESDIVLLQKGELVVKTINEKFEVKLFNASATAKINTPFKHDKSAKISFEVKALRDLAGKDIEIILN